MIDRSRIQASCPTCGEVQVRAEQMWLVLTDRPGHDHYMFRCHGCDRHVRRHANDTVVAVLARRVPVERMQIPEEALEPRHGETLTTDDLIDLMLALDEPSAHSSGGSVLLV